MLNDNNNVFVFMFFNDTVFGFCFSLEVEQLYFHQNLDPIQIKNWIQIPVKSGFVTQLKSHLDPELDI